MSTTSYQVTGLTCRHCVQAVSEEVGQLDGVTAVTVDLVAEGTSTLTVLSTEPPTSEAVAAALDEAGDYQLA
jgi:copper chaperone CopZ